MSDDTKDLPKPDQEQREPLHWLKSNVDVIYMNINSGSDFNSLRTGTDDSVHAALLQCAKHVERGLYRVVSISASEHSFVVVMSTELSQRDLLFKNGFPWDIPEKQT
jgi:hypothetical protein